MGYGQYTGHDSKRDRGYPSEAEAVANARTSYIRKADQLKHESEDIVWSRKWGPTGVKYRTESGKIVFRLYDTNVVVVRPNGDLELNTGGWHTPTTRNAMGDACEALYGDPDDWGSFLRVSGDKGNPDGRNHVSIRSLDFHMNFEDGIVIPSDLLTNVNPIWEN